MHKNKRLKDDCSTLQQANRLAVLVDAYSSKLDLKYYLPTAITIKLFSLQRTTPVPSAKTTVYWFLRSFTNVLLICRSMRLQTRSSAASVRYLGHTPITARQRDELCRGNIFMESSHFFEYYSVFILRLSPGRGSEQQAAVAERWQLGWLGLKVDLSSLYANALAPRQSSVGDALRRAPTLFF